MSMTARTSEDSEIQGHLLPMSTGATCLTRIGRVDFDVLSASFFRFARELTKECRPRGICNAFGKTMVMGHAVHRQVFYRNDSEVVNDLPAFLMREIVTPELDTLMDSSHGFTLFVSLGGPLHKRALLTLDLSKGFLFLAKKARVGYLLSIGEGSKGFQAYINPHLGRHIRQTKRFTLTGKRDVPLACSRTLHRTGFHLALARAMVDHLQRANLGEAHAVVMGETKATLRKSEGVVSLLPLETRKARVRSLFSYSTEKGFESQVNPNRNILQDLRMNPLERRMLLFQDRKDRLLLKTGERDTVPFVGGLAHFQQVVIEPTTLFKGFVELLLLLLGRIETVLKHFQHISIVGQTEQECKREAAPHLPQRRNAAFILMDQSQGLSAAVVGKLRSNSQLQAGTAEIVEMAVVPGTCYIFYDTTDIAGRVTEQVSILKVVLFSTLHEILLWVAFK